MWNKNFRQESECTHEIMTLDRKSACTCGIITLDRKCASKYRAMTLDRKCASSVVKKNLERKSAISCDFRQKICIFVLRCKNETVRRKLAYLHIY